MLRLVGDTQPAFSTRAAGFTLIEILVALVITLVGLMGAAGLMVRTVKQETESYQRLQALSLLQDMTDRIQANRLVASCYSDGGNGISVGTASDGSAVAADDIADCVAGTAAQNSRADTDLEFWNTALQGAAEQTSGGNNIGAMIGARGCIQLVDVADQIYRITVAWQGLSETVAAAADNTCGKDLYGTDSATREKLRRTVSTIVRIGDLT